MSSIGTTTNVVFVEQPRIWRSTISFRWLKVELTTSVISRRYARVVIVVRGRGLRQKISVTLAQKLAWIENNQEYPPKSQPVLPSFPEPEIVVDLE
jgi:hypothetical protein